MWPVAIARLSGTIGEKIQKLPDEVQDFLSDLTVAAAGIAGLYVEPPTLPENLKQAGVREEPTPSLPAPSRKKGPSL